MEDEDHNWIRQVKDGVVQYLNQLKPSQRLQIGGVEAVKLLHELTEVCIFPFVFYSVRLNVCFSHSRFVFLHS